MWAPAPSGGSATLLAERTTNADGYFQFTNLGPCEPYELRLVNGANGDEDGRNVMLTTGGGAVNGLTMGLFQSYFFGYPNWTFTADTSGNLTTDFAFQLYGIPEPASLVLLIAGGLLFRRR